MRTSEIDVWVVEDSDLLRSTLVQVLENEPSVRCTLAARTGEEALAAFAAGQVPNVVLMDLGLPGMDGVECIRRLKAGSPTSHIIVLTVYEDNEKIFDALCAGASGYLLKPTDGAGITNAIRSALAGGAPINAQIARRVLAMLTGRQKPRGDYGLTPREQEILQLLTEGHSQKRISTELEISPHTVDSHLRNIYAKLQVHSRTAAVAKALNERLV